MSFLIKFLAVTVFAVMAGLLFSGGFYFGGGLCLGFALINTFAEEKE